MRLNELRLHAFGRFRERVLALGPGLNLVFGPNEAGKSTCLRFIQGMLYGFARPGLKSRRLLPEYEGCRPWIGDGYSGTLLLTLDDGRRLRVERNFARHQARVYDEASGAPVDFPVDSRSEPRIAQDLLGLSRDEFVSTVCIGQLECSAVDPERAAALAARMAALQATGRDDESAARAVAALEARLRAEVGTPRARQSPLGAALAEWEQVRAEVHRVRRAREEHRGREAARQRLELELVALHAEEEQVRAAAARVEAAARLAQLQRILAHAAAVQRHAAAVAAQQATLAPLAAMAQLDPGEAARVPAYFEAYAQARDDDARAEAEQRQQAGEITRLDGELASLAIPGDPAAVRAEAERLQAACDRLQALAAARAAAPAGSRAVWPVLAAAVAAAAVVLAAILSPWALLLLVVSLVLLWPLLRRQAPPGLSELQSELAICSRQAQALLAQCGATTLAELRERCRRAELIQARRDGAAQALSALAQRRRTLPPLSAALARLSDRLQAAAACSPGLARALASGQVNHADVEGFTHLWEGYRNGADQLAAASRALDQAWVLVEAEVAALAPAASGSSWARALGVVCSRRDPRALASVAAEAQGAAGGAHGLPAVGAAAAGGEEPGAERAVLERRRAQLTERIRTLAAEVGSLQGMLRQADEDLPDLADLERRHRELEERVRTLELHQRAMERARAAITAVGERLHRDFAPRLAARVGPIVTAITGSRYRGVRVSDQLTLTAELFETGDFRPVHALSGGTVDQFYFALRIAAALELSAGGERPPILCDDSLLQYDDDRAASCLRYLANIGQTHQVVLFTCHGRERTLALRLGAHLAELM